MNEVVKLCSLKASPRKKPEKKFNYLKAVKLNRPVYRSPKKLYQEYSARGELKYCYISFILLIIACFYLNLPFLVSCLFNQKYIDKRF